MQKNNQRVSNKTTVSIVTISFNQERYIAQTLKSFIEQDTKFNFEIIVADDHSTDNTANIIIEYSKKYPDKFKLILRKKNVGVQRNLKEALMAATGKYVALCEGDDFWTDPLKLQKQVDYLDSHEEYGLVFHPVRVFFENHEEKDAIFPEVTDSRYFTLKNLLKHNYIQTNSVMYRRVNYEDLPLDIMPFDWYLHLIHARSGRIGFINEVMSAYRRHAGGVWWESDKDLDQIWIKYGYAHLSLYIEISKLFSNDASYRKLFNRFVDDMFERLLRIDKQYKTKHLDQVLKNYPLTIVEFAIRQYDKIKDGSDKINKLIDENQLLLDKVTMLDRENKNQQHELDCIKSSKLWKIRRIYGSIKYFVKR